MKSNFLFPTKEMYRLENTKSGKLVKLSLLSKCQRYKIQQNNMHLMEGIQFTEENGFPIVKPFLHPLDFEIYPYTMHNTLHGKGQALHFFIDDYKFSNACDKYLERTTYSLIKFDILFAPDYSLYVDMPIQINKHNIFRSRFAAAYWQKCGFYVVPVASWGSADTFPFCFEGLPSNSIIAVCGVGVKWCSSAYRLWQYGMRTLEEVLHPTMIIVYGEDLEVPGLSTPLFFIKDHITEYFR